MAEAKQWTDHSFPGHRKNAAQTADAGAAKEAKQHCFRLIIQGMCSSDVIEFACVDQLVEEAIAQLTGCSLDAQLFAACMQRGTGRCGVELKAIFLRQCRGKAGISL